MSNDAENVLVIDAAKDRRISKYVMPSSNQGLVRLCVITELDPGAYASFVDSGQLWTG